MTKLLKIQQHHQQLVNFQNLVDEEVENLTDDEFSEHLVQGVILYNILFNKKVNDETK